ncbi:flagellar hook-basal body complex protein FliE [Colwellia sp. Arc7-635]|uniref:flagellar hook-basal body complex protein FliE n=1 Tax=Colwellia sp. Arc7-635 TaxID=2497879 RepID=UPI0026C0352F
MTTVNNSLLAQMQSMSLEALAKPQANNEIVNKPNNSFGDLLTNALESVTEIHKDAGRKITAFELGDRSLSLADVMVAGAKAGVVSTATMQVS